MDPNVSQLSLEIEIVNYDSHQFQLAQVEH